MKSASSRSAKPRTPKPKRSSGKSKTDWARLFSGKPGVPTLESPEVTPEHFRNGVWRRNLVVIPTPKVKVSIALRVDHDVLEWFKSHGPGYQTRMNAVLRAFRDASI